MVIAERDRQVLSGLTIGREQHEELADLLDFYYDLYAVQFEAKAQLPDPEVRDEMAMRWRLEGGIPQLTFDQLGLEPGPFARLVAEVMEVLVRHNPQWQSPGDVWSPEKLMALAREVFETWGTLTAPNPEAKEDMGRSWQDHLAALAVGSALAPYLQRAAEIILPRLDLALWGQSHCPICGGHPNFALLERDGGARHLMCSRCNGLWYFTRLKCPFCESSEKQRYYPSEDGVYRLYVCSACNRYLKTIDMREVHRKVQPVVERLLTIGMDLTAQQEGYGS
jgi:formate dehydrogenase maturation protein FdhE